MQDEVEGQSQPDAGTVLYDLDLTNAHLHSLDEVSLPNTMRVLDATANRLKSIEAALLRLDGLTKLCLRQNLLTSAEEVEALASAPCLEELDLRDNQFTQVPNFRGFFSLTNLDMSYNQFVSLEALSSLPGPRLTHLYCAANKIASMEGIAHLESLRVLDLGSNRLRCIEGLEGMCLLDSLWLGRNRITQINGLSSLSRLIRLSLQSNRLARISGLSGCTALEELYLSHNGLTTLEGLEGLANLRILDVANNRLTSLAGLQGFPQLTDLWANDNQLASLDEAGAELEHVRDSLTCLYLGGNPCAKETQYRLRLEHTLPNLEQLDDSVLRGA
ncbi:hypothetical protein ACKKBG_A23930 [Auxenochlorella protothecoides x Auxenochlorella symbiontica]